MGSSSINAETWGRRRRPSNDFHSAMAPSTDRSNMAWGPKRGHATTAIAQKERPSRRVGKQSKRSAFVKSIVREVAGFAPYERRVMELIRNSKDKKARKLTKKRLGTLRRAKRKVDELTGVIAEQRRHAAQMPPPRHASLSPRAVCLGWTRVRARLGCVRRRRRR